jgi:hypothetical protein
MRTGNVLLASYNVQKPLTKEQELQIVQLDVLECSGETIQNNTTAVKVSEAHAAFYKKNTNRLIDRFICRDGKRVKANEDTYFLPADMCDTQ